MNKRGSWGAMTDRLAQTRRDDTPAEAPHIQHCWVNGAHGRVAGLLLEWRQTSAGWQGRVVRPTLSEGEWVIVEDWVDRGLLDQVQQPD